MTIAHLCQSADANIGGSLTVARALVHEQRALGVDARLVCLYDSNAGRIDAAASDEDVLCRIERRSRWRHGIRLLREKLAELKPEVIHHHDGLLWPRLATVGLGCPLVTHGHLGRPQTPWWSIASWTHRYIAAHTDCLVAISPWVAESWIVGGFESQRVKLIPNGVDCAKFFPRDADVRATVRERLALREGQKLLLWAGRLDRETKGLDRLVAVARLLPSHIKLAIAGDGPSRGWLEAQLQSFDPPTRPLLLGKLDEPAELFGVADAFVFTSKVEPFGLVLLEATSSGLPIYAFECEGGGSPLLHELGAMVVHDEDAAELVAAIATMRLQPDPDLRDRVRRQYSWDAVARATLKVYEELLDK